MESTPSQLALVPSDFGINGWETEELGLEIKEF